MPGSYADPEKGIGTQTLGEKKIYKHICQQERRRLRRNLTSPSKSQLNLTPSSCSPSCHRFPPMSISLHHDTYLPTLICWQMIGFDNTLCVGNCTTFLKSRKLSAMMLYGYRLTVGISLRTMKLSANVFRQNKCRRFLNKPTI